MSANQISVGKGVNLFVTQIPRLWRTCWSPRLLTRRGCLTLRRLALSRGCFGLLLTRLKRCQKRILSGTVSSIFGFTFRDIDDLRRDREVRATLHKQLYDLNSVGRRRESLSEAFWWGRLRYRAARRSPARPSRARRRLTSASASASGSSDGGWGRGRGRGWPACVFLAGRGV